MCELFGLSSRLPTRATFSLKAFASHGGNGSRNIDGWGLAFRDGHDVRLYKEPEPAADSAWLAFIAERRIASRLVLSHIRHATRGDLSLANTQPFVRELGGRMHVFAHNGRLDGIDYRLAGQWRRFQPVGETDSEIAFCILLERLAALWRGPSVPPVAERLAIVEGVAAEMRDLGPANFLYSDGDILFAHGDRRLQADGRIAAPGLWRLERACDVDADALAEAGVKIEAPRPGQRIMLVASVPLSEEGWVPFAPGELVTVKDGGRLTASPTRTEATARPVPS